MIRKTYQVTDDEGNVLVTVAELSTPDRCMISIEQQTSVLTRSQAEELASLFRYKTYGDCVSWAGTVNVKED
jgi:hypothetical protein